MFFRFSQNLKSIKPQNFRSPAEATRKELFVLCINTTFYMCMKMMTKMYVRMKKRIYILKSIRAELSHKKIFSVCRFFSSITEKSEEGK